MASTLDYQQQFERTKRWYERIQKTDQGTSDAHSIERCQDELYAFFMNCYHLKDWIKNDGRVTLPPNEVEDFVNSNDCMKLLADVCNGIKHLKRDRERSGENPEFGARAYNLHLGGKPIVSIKWFIATRGGNIDAFLLATDCMRKWEEFIRINL